MTLRVTVVSHSLCHPRQYDFFGWLRNHSQGEIEIQEIYPANWGNNYRSMGFGVTCQDMVDFMFHPSALRVIEKFNPSILYVQQELYCRATRQLFEFRNRVLPKTAFVAFVWENLHSEPYSDPKVREIIDGLDWCVFGSTGAKELLPMLAHRSDVFPQVGVQTSRFQPSDSEREYDLVFVGRQAKIKGWAAIEKMLERNPHWKLHRIGGEKMVGYSDMPAHYNLAKVHISPVLDTPYWCEQWLSFAHAEALSCGLRCVGSRTAGVVEYAKDIPGFYFCEQNDVHSLTEAVENALEKWELNDAGRKWAIANVGYQAIAEKTVLALKKGVEARSR